MTTGGARAARCLTPAEGRKPTLLFLARPFPPLRATACARTWNITKHLAQLGWDVTVVTPHPSVWRRVDDVAAVEAVLRNEGIERILTEHHYRWMQPDHLHTGDKGLSRWVGGLCRRIAWRIGFDGGIGWARAARRMCAARDLSGVDIILATGSPFASFRLARDLARKLRCPYVLDYRDPWTGNPHAPRPSRPSHLRQEAALLDGCGAATIVSPSWARELGRRFGIGSKLHVVTNGYDPDELKDIRPYDFGHAAIIYAGKFYPPKRVITPVMAALKRLEAARPRSRWYFHYYGNEEHHVRHEAVRCGVLDRVILHGNVSRREVLAALRGACASVVITSVEDDGGPEDDGIVPGKVFEAMGAGTPVLLVSPPRGDVQRMAAETGLIYGFRGDLLDDMTAFLGRAVDRGLPAAPPPDHYAWPSIARKLDLILRALLHRQADEGAPPVPERDHGG
ncbi:glycosyltransferase [Candidatus Nitrospira bockiana]